MSSTRWLVLGAGGMLGRDLTAVLSDRSDVVLTAATRSDVDVRDADAVRRAVAAADIVINSSAWTDVDGAEADPAGAMAVNGDAVGVLATACAETGIPLIHVSTDYVFPGDATQPYAEDAPTAPINAYGRSKLAGEQHVLRELPRLGYVVRTAWLYGEHGRNFVRTMLTLAQTRETVEVVDDQRGQPTWSGALAVRLVELGQRALAGTAPPGVYHGTASGETTWYGLARAAYELAGLDPDRVRPTTSQAFVRPAPRPSYSVLGHARWTAAGLPPLADWRAMLTEAMPRLIPAVSNAAPPA
jgi:dTDP-4-dehydrorhamnose reductase